MHAPALITMGRCGRCEGCGERDRTGFLGGEHLSPGSCCRCILTSIPLKGAKRSLFSHFGNADTQLLGDLPAAVGLCEKSEAWLLLGDWLSGDLKAGK